MTERAPSSRHAFPGASFLTAPMQLAPLRRPIMDSTMNIGRENSRENAR